MRIFIGIDFGEGQKEAIMKVQGSLRNIAQGRFTRAQNLHLTLNFLGEVDEAKLSDVFRAVDEVAAETKFFSLAIGRLGQFPSGRKKIIWLGMEGSKELYELYDRLSEKFGKIGFMKEERPYSPHLTLAREAKLEKPLDTVDVSPLSGIGMAEVTEITVFESTSRSGVLEYLPLHSAKLL
ncbi:RNA 2',3'-cyclic phosphodiesterase [Youngiibacter multivorans]|uniref:RNA 2',3'-cyclic phosphodiesterase n=1 Tax=Youngiibacter multivorans TaxID=937251 RepID=A0ABS4G5V6_9CLOT|nr:RNA 2',3'-cyclic phosphodiesterase [Youngiibacter multivorans]MBP1919914.1 2'-5' RNA ligase [Youngiibacter multivorans]